MAVYVTGGTGLVGSRLLALLAEKEKDRITAVKRPDSDLSLVKKHFERKFREPEIFFNKIEWVEGDILDTFFIEETMSPGSTVYHAAAFVSFNSEDNDKIKQINIQGTANVVNACLRNNAKKLCHVSSIAALGRSRKNEAVTEKDYRTTEKDSSVYSLSKYQGEMEVWRGIAEGLKAVIVNPAVILGSGKWSEGSARLFDTVYKGLKFYTAGTNGYVDAEDVASAMIMLCNSDISGERFILSAQTLSYKELFYEMAKGLKVKPPPYYASPFTGEIAWRLLAFLSFFSGKKPMITRQTARMSATAYDYSSEKIKSLTGFRFSDIKQTIRRTCNEYLEDKNLV